MGSAVTIHNHTLVVAGVTLFMVVACHKDRGQPESASPQKQTPEVADTKPGGPGMNTTAHPQKASMGVKRTSSAVPGLPKPAPAKAPMLRSWERAVSFRSGDLTLPGTLAMPSPLPGTLLPGIVLVHGSGPQNRDEEIRQAGYTFQPFRELSDLLVKKGYAVLRYDKRAFVMRDRIIAMSKKGETAHLKKALATMTQQQFLNDALAAIAWLGKTRGIDKGKLVVLGHSIAGLYASQLAAKSNLAGMILIAPEILPFKEHLLTQAKLQLGLVVSAEKEMKGSLTYALSKKKIEQQKAFYKKMIKGYEEAFAAMKNNSFPKGGKILGISLREFNSTQALSEGLPGKYAALKIPLLYVNGENDWICPVGPVRRFGPILQRKKDLTLVILKDMNHFMYTNSPIAFSEELGTTVTKWLAALFRR